MWIPHDFVGMSRNAHARDAYPGISHNHWRSSRLHKTLVTSVTLVLTMFSKSAKRQKTLQLAVLQFLATLTLKEYMKEYKCICVPLTM